ncbi:MAG: hypothetical protein JNK04_17890 [Myxococcales bacterium]|nr:hypothetical protein [Myxococcales bacterium]
MRRRTAFPLALVLCGCPGAIGGNETDEPGGSSPTTSTGALPSAGGATGQGGSTPAPVDGGAAEGGQPNVASSSTATTGSGVDPTGDWQVGDVCAVEIFEPGVSCDNGMGFGSLDPSVPNPCPDNCVRNNHVCTWTCRPTCTPNPDACGPDPCVAQGYGQCAAGICWPFTHGDCVNQGLCADCASAPCP